MAKSGAIPREESEGEAVHARKGQPHPLEKSRELQRRLYLAAKRSGTRRFHALYDRIVRPDVLWRAWVEVRANQGSPGVDGVSIEDVERDGVETFLGQLADDLRAQRYRPSRVLRVEIPRPDGRTRPLGIPTVRDRVVQQACKIIIEPLFEANFLPSSYGYRPKRIAGRAVLAVKQALVMRWWVLDADIEYLHTLDRWWQDRHAGVGQLHRYCDDFVTVCRGRLVAERARELVAGFLGRLKLTLHPTKTRVVDMGREGFDFLGFHFHKLPSKRTGRLLPYAWPSQKAMKAVRAKIREQTERTRLRVELGELVGALNALICGWRAYFSIGNSTKKLADLDRYVRLRLWRFLKKRQGPRGRLLSEAFVEWERRSGLAYFYPTGRRALQTCTPQGKGCR